MSVINKQSYLDSVLGTLTSAQIGTLKDLVDGSSQQPAFRSLIDQSNYITNSDKGVSHIVLETQDASFTGYLIFTDIDCCLIGYSDFSQNLSVLKINLVKMVYEYVNEVYSITDLRLALGGSSGTVELTYATNEEIDALFEEPEPEPEPTTYTVAYSSMDSHITFSDDQAEVEENDSFEVYIVPNEGYRIKTGPSVIIMMGGINVAMTAFNSTTGRIYIEHVTGDVRITAISVAEPIPASTWSVSYTLTNAINSGSPITQVQNGGSLSVTIQPDGIINIGYRNCNVIMGGVNITSEVADESTDDTVIYIPSVTGDVSIEVEYQEEEVPIESIRYTDGQGNTCVGFGMLEGESVDLWTNLEILPADYTDGVEFISDDDGIIQVDSGGIATATGVSGESTIITISSMEDPTIYTTVEISISTDDDEEEEE